MSWTAMLTLALSCPGLGQEPGGNPEIDLQLGKKRFESYCATCHQLEGIGIEGRVPPLTKSPWVAGPESRLIRIVLHGLRGPIEIQGQVYNMEMPSFRVFPDHELAALLSYVRQKYGKPSPAISAATIGKVREETRKHLGYWTVAELLEVTE